MPLVAWDAHHRAFSGNGIRLGGFVMLAPRWIRQLMGSKVGRGCASAVGCGIVACYLSAEVEAQGARALIGDQPAAAPPAAMLAPAPYPTYGFGYAQPQAYGYGYGQAGTGQPQWVWAQPAAYGPYHGGQYPCPCPPEGGVGLSDEGGSSASIGDGDDESVIDDAEDLPEVADLSSDAAFAAAGQSAAPNMIGDTIGFGGSGILAITDGIVYDAISVSPGAGRRYKAATNNSPLPQTRIIYNFHYFDNALTAVTEASMWSIDVKRQDFGFEYAFWPSVASLQVMVPVNWTIDSTLEQPVGVIPTPHDVELGNVSLALKSVLYQNCYATLSLGAGFDLPTADDIIVDTGLQRFELTNETVTASPFAGLLVTPTCNTFVQSFVQYSIPLNDNGIEIGDTFTEEASELKMVYVDLSVGAWLCQDACGNGIAALGEIHYSTTVGDEALVAFSDAGVDTTFLVDNWKTLNATAGVAVVWNCWSVTPAIVLPLLEDPDRFFDWEATLQVNRRF
jgi:hypothetical protein